MRAAFASASGSSQQPHGHGARSAWGAAPRAPWSPRAGCPVCAGGLASCTLAAQGAGASAPPRQGIDPAHTQMATRSAPKHRAGRRMGGTLHESDSRVNREDRGGIHQERREPEPVASALPSPGRLWV
jgi:hypothetical protein